MQVTQLRARAGSGWVREGFRLLRAAPIPMFVITMSYMLLLIIVMAVPRIGAFAPLLLTPLFSVGLMHAVRAIDEKRPASPMMLFAPFKDRGGKAWQPLLLIGVVNAVATLLALGLASMIDGGAILDIATGGIDENDPRLQSGAVMWSALVFALLYTPVQMSLWYAPLFVAWHAMPTGKALFISLVAVARNKWAFVNYLITWMGVAAIASLLVQFSGTVFAGISSIASLLLMAISLVLLTAFYCSYWPSYRDAVRGDTGGEDPREDSNVLLGRDSSARLDTPPNDPTPPDRARPPE